MSSKFIHAKYLAVVLLGIVFLVLASIDAFSQSEKNPLVIANAESTTLTIHE